jgi:hypothetical protein
MSDVMYFHAHNIAHTPEEIAAAGGDEINYPQINLVAGQEYKAWPCQVEGWKNHGRYQRRSQTDGG